jgi:hypothetical protein
MRLTRDLRLPVWSDSHLSFAVPSRAGPLPLGIRPAVPRTETFDIRIGLVRAIFPECLVKEKVPLDCDERVSVVEQCAVRYSPGNAKLRPVNFSRTVSIELGTMHIIDTSSISGSVQAKRPVLVELL